MMFGSREVVNRGWSVLCMNVEDALGKRRGKAWHAGKAASADARSKWVLLPKKLFWKHRTPPRRRFVRETPLMAAMQ